MGIYTRGGDQGETSLPEGDRVAKNHPRIRGYGALDEVAARLAWLAAHPEVTGPHRERLATLTEMAMEAGGVVAHAGGDRPDKPGSPADMEAWIDEMTEAMPPLANFILPLGTPAATACHVVRTACRRLERTLVEIAAQDGQVVPDWVRAWVNRLSDYLFSLARFLNHEAGKGDTLWRR